jgi:hypothetical protein
MESLPPNSVLDGVLVAQILLWEGVLYDPSPAFLVVEIRGRTYIETSFDASNEAQSFTSMKDFEQRAKMESAYVLKDKIDAEETRRFVHPILSSTRCSFAQTTEHPRNKVAKHPRLGGQHEFVTVPNDGQYLHPSIPLAGGWKISQM